MLSFHELASTPKSKNAVVFLHGLGTSGYDFVPMAQKLQLRSNCHSYLLHAPNRPITINNNMVVRAWYDMKNMQLDKDVDIKGIEESSNLLVDFIHNKLSMYDFDNIYLIGFSQGGLIALYTALNFDITLGGIAVLSSYYPFKIKQKNTIPSILIGHGLVDRSVPVQNAYDLNAQLKLNDFEVTLKTYPIEHTISDNMIKDISSWIDG